MRFSAGFLAFSHLTVLLAGLGGCVHSGPGPEAAGTKPATKLSFAEQQAAIRVTCPHIPAPPPGTTPPAPASAFPKILLPGHWDWSELNYVWTPPEWQTKFSATQARWHDGHWQVTGGGCVWHKGFLGPVE